MTDLDRLREDLRHADHDIPFGPPDLAAVMSTGRRIRRRRRLVNASVAGLAVVAVTGAVFSIGRLGPGPGPVLPAAPAAPASAAPPALPTPTQTGPAPTDGSTPHYDDRPVRTGIMLAEGEFTLLVQALSNDGTPDVRFGISAAVILPDNRVKGLVGVSEMEGSDASPGFHAGYRPISIGANRVPQFGYYAGPAARIVGETLDGTIVEAAQSLITIAGDPIVLYWFDPATAGPDTVSDMIAYGESGEKLPIGDNSTSTG